MSESAKQLESLIARGYKHGFVTDIDSDTVAPGLDEDVVRLISRKKGEPAFLTEWRLKALRHWLTMKEPHWSHVQVRAHRLPGHLLLLGAQVEAGRPEEPRGRRPEAAGNLREARRTAARARAACRCGGRRGVRQRLGGHHLQGAPGRRRGRVLSVLRSGAHAPAAHRAVPGQRRALHRQLLRDAQLRGVHRRLVRVRAQGRALPDGAVDVLSHQCRQDRAVRAHADHRGCWKPCVLP